MVLGSLFFQRHDYLIAILISSSLSLMSKVFKQALSRQPCERLRRDETSRLLLEITANRAHPR